jgi:CBS domain-containing membrane protein
MVPRSLVLRVGWTLGKLAGSRPSHLSPRVKLLLRLFAPVASPAVRRHAEMLRIMVGAMLGLLFSGFATQWIFGPSLSPLLLAPIGASAVLLFGLPASPLAQPWSIIGGHLVAGLIGVFVHNLWPSDPLLAAPVALMAAVCGMTLLRCVHPPSGAVAITVILGGPEIHQLGYWFVVNPLLTNSALLLIAAVIYNNLTGHRYPAARAQALNVHDTRDPAPTARAGYLREDLEAALNEHEGMLAVGPEELDQLLRRVEQHAHERRYGRVTMQDIMSADLVLVNRDTTLADAVRLMEHHRLQTLPVVEANSGHMVGVVDYASASQRLHQSTMLKLGRLAVRHPLRTAHTIGQLARGHDEQTVPRTLPVEALVPMLADQGHHAAYVVDDSGRLCGIVTQSDLIAALYHERIVAAPASATRE